MVDDIDIGESKGTREYNPRVSRFFQFNAAFDMI